VLDGVPFKGPEAAPVRVVEYSDFMCPFCRNLAGAFAGFMPQSEDKVSVYFKNYPLDQACNPIPRTVHDGACELALGGICANQQGKFWSYHDQVFAQEWHSATKDDVLRLATSAGLDSDAMRQCLDSSAAKDQLTRDIQEGKRLEVNATPTVYINGKRLEQIGGFMVAVESELKRLGIPLPRPR
jgi:protein-disulfide isomerase